MVYNPVLAPRHSKHSVQFHADLFNVPACGRRRSGIEITPPAQDCISRLALAMDMRMPSTTPSVTIAVPP